MRQRITLKDVARAAQVAPATASHALNENGTVSAATALRVRRIAREIGYRPHKAAASLRRKRTSTIGVVIPNVSNPFFGHLFEALDAAWRAKGYNLLSGTTNYDQALEKHYIDLFLGCRCDGIIISGQPRGLADIVQAGVPTVLIDCHVATDLVKVPVVEVEDMHGMYSAVAHLIRLGHRRIALVSYVDPEIQQLELRHQGYCRALSDAGISHDADLVVRIDDMIANTRGAYVATRKLLAEHSDITAIVTTADIMAFGVIRAAHDLHRRVPGDLAVVGFDNISMAEAFVPSLTTVAQPVELIAQHAVGLTIEQIEEGGVALDRRRVSLQTRLVIRESCGGGVASS